MNKLQALNTWMTPKMPLLILGALALGLLFPDQIGLLCPAVSALMMFQTFANSLGSSVQDLGRVLSHPKPVLITMLSLHLLMPLAALGIGSMCFPDQPLYTLSLVLMEGSPAAVSSLMWIVIGGGSVELCLSIILLDTMLSPVILPLTLRLLCGSVVELDTLGMIRDLFVMIVVPAALAMVLCRLLGQSICAKAKQRLSPFSKLALLVIICANVTRCAPFLHELNRELVLLLCITLAMRLIGLGLGFLLSTLFRFPYPVELTVTVNSSMRNNAAAATLAAQYFPRRWCSPPPSLPCSPSSPVLWRCGLCKNGSRRSIIPPHNNLFAKKRGIFRAFFIFPTDFPTFPPLSGATIQAEPGTPAVSEPVRRCRACWTRRSVGFRWSRSLPTPTSPEGNSLPDLWRNWRNPSAAMGSSSP